jgi:hypothetical protein
MISVRKGKAIAEKHLAQREALWPGVSESPWLWHRLANKGFATIPKTMPLVLQIMDDLSNGKRVSPTYLGLWCETWDNSFVNISSQGAMAHAAGFTGQRAVYTWQERMKLLQTLRFIDIKPGKFGPISHVLIWNPHKIIRMHNAKKTHGLVEGNYNALLDRALEIGAKDMLEDLPATAPVASAASTDGAGNPSLGI